MIYKKKCVHCQREIIKKPNCSLNSWENRVKFCSRGCHNDFRRGKPSCSSGTTFKKGQVGYWKGKKNLKISGEKNNKWKGGQVEIQCQTCSKIFPVDPYMKKTAKSCSMKCAKLYRKSSEFRNNLSKVHKAKFKGIPITPFLQILRESTEYKQWRESVLKRDDFTCQVCKVRGGKLHADHLKSFAFFPKLRFVVSNGQTLCVMCHRKTPNYGFKTVNSKTS